MDLRRIIFPFVLATLAGGVHGQCPMLYDYYGTPSTSPQWYSCSGTSFTLVVATPQTVGGFTIDWGDGSPQHVGASLAPPQMVNHLYPASVNTYTIVFTELASGCVITGTLTMEQSTSASIQIPVGGLTQVCAPHPVEFINSSTNVSPNTVFTWDFGDGSPLLTFDHTNLGQTVTHMYEQGTVDCETTVRLTAENTCNTLQGGPSFATFNPIRIWDLDDAMITPSATLLCWPDNEVTYLNTTARNCLAQGNIFQRYEYWNFGDYWGTGQDSIIDWTPWPPTFPRTIAYPGIGTYEVMMLDSNYCGVDTARITITIVPPPTVSLVADPTTICAGGTVNFQQTTVGGANYFQWDFGTGNGYQWTAAGDQNFTYDTPGTYTASYTASIQGATAGCADTASVVITVLPSPTAAFSLDQDAACDSLTVTITDASIDALVHAWDFGDGTTSNSGSPGPHFYGTAGDHIITLTVTNALGCEHSAAHPVNVYDPPTVGITVQNLCFGGTATFSPMIGTAPGNPVITWDWDFGDGTTSNAQEPAHTYAAPGPYVVTLTVWTPYCGNSGTQWVNVQARPEADLEPSVQLGCSPLAVAFTNQSTGATMYTWNFGDGTESTEVSPTHTFVNTTGSDTVFTVQLIAASAYGCADTAAVAITVAPAVVASFTHNGLPGCAPLSVTFTNTSSGAGAYLWDFGDGTTSTAMNPAHTYVNNSLLLEVRTVTLTATSTAGCTSTVSQQVMVYPMPQFNFEALPSSGCSPLTVTFPSQAGAVDHQWDFGDGTTASGSTPTHTYTNTTLSDALYTVTMVGMNAFGCTSTASTEVVVHPQPVAQFTTTVPAGCQPLEVGFQDMSLGATTVSWWFGDGGSLINSTADPIHVYTHGQATPVEFEAMLVAVSANGCVDTVEHVVEVYPHVQAAFTLPAQGCSPFTMNITQQSTGAEDYLWTMGDGTTLVGDAPQYTYTNNSGVAIPYSVTLTATSVHGCTSEATQQVVVFPAPVSAFQAAPYVQQFPDATVTITNGSSPSGLAHEWSFGDGGQSEQADPGEHTYATWGVFTISLTVSNGVCSATMTQDVTIVPPLPTAGFLGQGEGCAPLTVHFTNTSLEALSYQWNFGDGGTSTADHPTYVFNTPGTYTVVLNATGVGGGVNTAVKVDSIIVHPRATAFFVMQPTEVVVPNDPVFTYNLSANAGIYHWDMGDGTLYNTQDPVHYYTQPGTYDVSLVANNQWNCPDTFRLEAGVLATTAGELVFPNAFTPGSGGPTDGSYDPRSFDNDVFFPVHDGVEAYRLEIFNRWGELLYVSDDVRKGWDGYYRGNPAKQDVYVWKCHARFSDGRETVLKGDVTLLR